MVALSSSNALVIEQAEDGYKYSMEPFLLANFVTLSTSCRVLDVGTGCGIIPLLLATRRKTKRIVAIEIQNSLYNIAVKNILRNGASDSIQLIHEDFINSKLGLRGKLFDIVISNPPYRKLNTGRTNPNQEKAIARHELSIDLKSLIAKANVILKNGGIFTLAYPPTRLKELLEKLSVHELFPSKLRFIHGSQGSEASIFLINAIKKYKTECVVEPPLYIYNKDGSHSKEIKKIYGSFNYFSRTHHIEKK